MCHQSDIVPIICHRCRWHQRCTLTCENLREFSKKFEMTLMLFLAAWGKMIHEKKLKQKTSWRCPFSKAFFLHLPANFFYNPILNISLTQFSFHDRVWHLTRGSTIPTSRSLRASTAHSGSGTPAPFSFTSGSTQVSECSPLPFSNMMHSSVPVIRVQTTSPSSFAYAEVKAMLRIRIRNIKR